MGITINPPDLDDILDNLKNEIFANMNCVQIGKIKSYDVDTQSAEIEIQFNRRKNETETSSYPVLVDCPVFVLQGGGAYLNFPIKEDDFCLMLFIHLTSHFKLHFFLFFLKVSSFLSEFKLVLFRLFQLLCIVL